MNLAEHDIEQETIAGPCPEFPNGYGRVWRTEEPLPAIDLVRENPDFFESLLKETGVINVVNSEVGGSPTIPPKRSRFLPLHKDEVASLAFQASDRTNPRPFPFQTAPMSVAANGLRQRASVWLENRGLDLEIREVMERFLLSGGGDDYIVLLADRMSARFSTSQITKTFRTFLREAHTFSSPKYDHSFLEFPNSTLLVSGLVQHGRFVPEDLLDKADTPYLHSWISYRY
ncbi:MAG: hypothetical protein AAB383_02105 [Patescibacteria group bacterium]